MIIITGCGFGLELLDEFPVITGLSECLDDRSQDVKSVAVFANKFDLDIGSGLCFGFDR
jgi:hypothetical protein